MTSGQATVGLFIKTNLIYWVGIPAISQTADGPDLDLDGRRMGFIEKNSVICALVIGDTETIVNSVLTRFFGILRT